MTKNSVTALLDALREDLGRKEHPFSSDVQEANSVLHHPFVTPDEITRVMLHWSAKRQPCNFGRIGGKHGFIHFAILTERDLRGKDHDIRDKIAQEKRRWKQRALLNLDNPPHAFMLLVSSPRVALAAPDENLKRFAARIRDLAGFRPTRAATGTNPVVSDFLYLKNPADELYYGFQFNLDFFAAAGDQRWWHDHRVPGGIAFTANATGHMRAWQEWYGPDKGTDRSEFFVKNAMYTVAQAHPVNAAPVKREAGPAPPDDPVADGRVTWLRNLVDNKPLKDSPCPFKTETPKRLEGKDWTTYEGLLHTDHAVREEFFADGPEPPTKSAPYSMDFTYLYDKRTSDFVKFVAGLRLAEEDIIAELGKFEDWHVRGGEAVPVAVTERPQEAHAEVRSLLAVCERWTDSPDLISPATA